LCVCVAACLDRPPLLRVKRVETFRRILQPARIPKRVVCISKLGVQIRRLSLQVAFVFAPRARHGHSRNPGVAESQRVRVQTCHL